MRVVHESGGERAVLATDVAVADTVIARARGLMFRRSIPDDYALVFRFDGQARRDLHMLFVPFPIDAVWLCDGVVQQVERLRPWLGLGSAVADTVIELPAGAAEGVEAGDRVTVEPDADATEPNVDATKSDVDATKSDVDATKPDTDATEPNVDAMEPDADPMEPDADAMEPDADETG